MFTVFLKNCGGGCLVSQSCPALCDPMDCTLPGSSVRGISQARIQSELLSPLITSGFSRSTWLTVYPDYCAKINVP